MKIAFLGGSFNPPHVAHIDICRYILDRDLAEQVIMVPCFCHPFGKNLVSYKDRYKMCEISTAQFGNRVEVSDIEERLGKVSVTLGTIQALLKEHPKNSYHLVIGTDILKERHLWDGFEVLTSIAPPIILPRIGYNNTYKEIQKDIVFPDVSSTKVREMVLRGASIEGLVHPKIEEFIFLHNLYKDGTSWHCAKNKG